MCSIVELLICGDVINQCWHANLLSLRLCSNVHVSAKVLPVTYFMVLHGHFSMTSWALLGAQSEATVFVYDTLHFSFM